MVYLRWGSTPLPSRRYLLQLRSGLHTHFLLGEQTKFLKNLKTTCFEPFNANGEDSNPLPNHRIVICEWNCWLNLPAYTKFIVICITVNAEQGVLSPVFTATEFLQFESKCVHAYNHDRGWNSGLLIAGGKMLLSFIPPPIAEMFSQQVNWTIFASLRSLHYTFLTVRWHVGGMMIEIDWLVISLFTVTTMLDDNVSQSSLLQPSDARFDHLPCILGIRRLTFFSHVTLLQFSSHVKCRILS